MEQQAQLLVPDDLVYLLTSDHVGHVSCLRADGSIVTNLMWIDWDGEHVLTSSPVGSRKGAHWRRDPHASVSVVDRDDLWRYVIVRGRVSEIRPDEGPRLHRQDVDALRGPALFQARIASRGVLHHP